MREPPQGTERAPLRYQIPTHLEVPDTFAFPLVLFTLKVTAREGLILLVGWSLAFELWRRLAWLAVAWGAGGMLTQWGSALLLAAMALLLAKFKLSGRSLEEWGPILLRYQLRPRVYLWKPLPAPVPGGAPSRGRLFGLSWGKP